MDMDIEKIKRKLAPEIPDLEAKIARGREEINRKLIERNTITEAEFNRHWVILFNKKYQEDFTAGKPVPHAFTDAMKAYPKRFDHAMPVCIKCRDGSVSFIPPLQPTRIKVDPMAVIMLDNALKRSSEQKGQHIENELLYKINNVNKSMVDTTFKDDSSDGIKRRRSVMTARAMIKVAHDKIEQAKASQSVQKEDAPTEEDYLDDDDTEVF